MKTIIMSLAAAVIAASLVSCADTGATQPNTIGFYHKSMIPDSPEVRTTQGTASSVAPAAVHYRDLGGTPTKGW